MIADNLESVLKESMLAEPSAKVDAAILSAIRFRAKRNKRWRSFMPPMSIAAACAILLAGGWFWRVASLNDRELAEEGEIILDILGFATADDFYADAEL